MFNSVNNPFSQRIESALSTGQDRNQQQNQQEENQEKSYLGSDDKDEVQISELPQLSEDEVIYLTNNYISNLKEEHQDNAKIVEKLDKYLKKFDVKKFMKNNPNMTRADFYMIMFNETSSFIN